MRMNYSVKLNSLDLQCFHLAIYYNEVWRRGTYKALFSPRSHSKGLPVTSLRFTEWIISSQKCGIKHNALNDTTYFMSCVCRWRSLFPYDSWHVLCHVFADEGPCFLMIHDMFYVMCLPMKVTVSLWFMTCFMSCVCRWRSLFLYDSWHVLCHVFADEGHCFLMIHDVFYVMCLPMKVTVSSWFMTCFMSCVCR